MSLVATYVKCSDGQFYRLPIFGGNMHGCDWFICYDDDDPIELVVATQDGILFKDVIKGIRKEFLKYHCMIEFTKRREKSGRLFDGKFKDAIATWIEMRTPPVKLIQKHEGIVERGNIGQGVIYE